MTDELTGLNNRAYFVNCVTRTIQNDANGKYSFMILDIDKFKDVNDTYGHPVGDKCLRMVSKCMKEDFNSDFICCRLGGDEFAILCLNPHSKEELTDNIQRFKNDIILRSDECDGIKLTLSVGVINYVKGDDFETMYKLADSALYDAKNNGRNCISYYGKRD